jgi:hypothetical protein
MIFRVTPQATTLYDQIEYQGDPSDFAWVLPIQGPVQVGLSSDALFSALDQATQTTILAPPLPQCPVCACGSGTNGGSSSGAGGSSSSSSGGVTVISQMVVGPYETVQLQSSDPNALANWLASHGYNIPSDIAPVITAYVNEGFDFLAMRLVPGAGVSAMRPVRVTSPGAGLSLPLRMVAAGTGATVGITLWVIADGRYEPANFQSFTIDPTTITWDFGTGGSNYASLRASQEASLKNAAWQIESSIDVAPYSIESPLLYGFSGASSSSGISSSSSSSGDTASSEYLPIPASDGGAGETADQVRQDDLAVLFPGTNQGSVRVTRMRGDLSHAALAADLVLQASLDDSVLSNIYQVTKSVNGPTCSAAPCPCGLTTSSSGSSTSGSSTSGSSATSGTSGTSASSGSSGSSGGGGGGGGGGCATVGSADAGGLLDLGAIGVVGAAFVRVRTRRRRG